MREIKFRAWHKAHQQMYYSDFVVKFTGTLLWWVSEHGYEELMGTDKAIPMQYTGLKDKNGKEIYEGDIICVVEDALDGGQEGDFMEVVFDEFGCWSLDGGQIVKGDLLYEQNKYAEVIGNIYENPDLLTNN